MSDRVQVREAGPLLAVLVAALPGWKRSTLKDRLKAGAIAVNGETVTRHDHALKPGDGVEIGARGQLRVTRSALQLSVLYSDEHLIAIDKPSGLLSVSTNKESKRTALAMVRDTLGRRARLWLSAPLAVKNTAYGGCVSARA